MSDTYFLCTSMVFLFDKDRIVIKTKRRPKMEALNFTFAEIFNEKQMGFILDFLSKNFPNADDEAMTEIALPYVITFIFMKEYKLEFEEAIKQIKAQEKKRMEVNNNLF